MRRRGSVLAVGLALAGLAACGSDSSPNLSGLSDPQFGTCAKQLSVGARPAGTPASWSVSARDAYLRQPAGLDCVVALPVAERRPLLVATLGGMSTEDATAVLTAYVRWDKEGKGDADMLTNGLGRMLHYVAVPGGSVGDQNRLFAVRVYERTTGPLPDYPAWAARHPQTGGVDPALYYVDHVLLANLQRPEYAKAAGLVLQRATDISTERWLEARA